MQAPKFGWTRVSDRLGAWNFYFIAKAALFALGLVDFHLWANLAFAAALAAIAHRRTRAMRPWVATPVAIALLYYDSRLPGLARALSQAGLVASFSGSYLAELAGRFVNARVVAILAAAIAIFAIAYRFVRLDVFVAAGMVAIALWMGPREAPPEAAAQASVAASAEAAAQTPDAMVAQFFARESQRQVSFSRPAEGAPPFDVIFLHICSLSWDDLAASGLDKHPLLASFDILLERFNSVSTYSGPAAIRLLRAPCGQQRHDALYASVPAQCLLMPALEQAGLDTQLALNHDGHFDGFLDYVRAQGVQAVPVPLKGLDAPQRGFDDSRVYDDGAVLARWMESRSRSPSQRVALYYNTLSLHDGNHLVANPSAKSAETYRQRLARLLDQLNAFIDELGANGRRAVVVVVPEHGAALRGDSAQIPGLREIPTPAITLVPVGIRVVGPDAQRIGEAVRVKDATSFLAISHIVSAMLAKPPFAPEGFKASDYVAGLPVTPYVAEGESSMVIRRGDGYLLRQERDAWKELR